MSSFVVKVCSIIIEPHPDPAVERLELARIGDYLAVVGKDNHKTGDLLAYIPEQAIVPESLLIELGLQGKLAGSAKNRVKAMKLRGVLSQGLVYKAKPEWVEGQDVSVELGITKWEPPVPVGFGGKMISGGFPLNFDIENIKAHPDVIKEGELVVITEKIHGTCCIIGYHDKASERFPGNKFIDGGFQICTKNLTKQGLYFTEETENVYLRAFRENPIIGNFLKCLNNGKSVWLLGEVFGSGVQDLAYGSAPGKINFRVFAAAESDDQTVTWVDWPALKNISHFFQIPLVPVLYEGPFAKETLAAFTNGIESFSGKEAHIREGVVVTPQIERHIQGLGRVSFKSVSEAYLLRKGNTTEFT